MLSIAPELYRITNVAFFSTLQILCTHYKRPKSKYMHFLALNLISVVFYHMIKWLTVSRVIASLQAFMIRLIKQTEQIYT
ncbi:hypothetical protein AQUCO_09500034v1 [Aquilegia coerulea]|uniref:Uncharacterized protein n=1 Tax=Aquilegia coerulea TaxID=218851 RepID=A0A2G5C4U0_AQUCA|nr:hypothetical protein AQUCO_09500034v1 [Aquilegia coerulea]